VHLVLALIGITLLLVAMLIAVRIGMHRGKNEEEIPSPLIHGSGIYSIIRKSPRENLGDVKPSQEEIRKYLFDKNVNIGIGSASQKELLIARWNEQMEANIAAIESGDTQGAEFYYYDYSWDDPVCEKIIPRGRFVTREQIYQNPRLIPPFHFGCGCRLCKYQGKENLRETTEIGMLPLFHNGERIPLPDWKVIVKIEDSPSARPSEGTSKK
jgi:hypothetical protein